jgi:nondiscriminating aspartyl-tRNA synthetase
MLRTISADLASAVGQQVRIDGWLHNFRELGKMGFLIVRDRGGLIQVVVHDANTLKDLSELQPGSVVRVVGTVKETEATEIGVELVDPAVEIKVPIHEVPPVAYNKKSIDVNIDTELDYRPLCCEILKAGIF